MASPVSTDKAQSIYKQRQLRKRQMEDRRVKARHEEEIRQEKILNESLNVENNEGDELTRYFKSIKSQLENPNSQQHHPETRGDLQGIIVRELIQKSTHEIKTRSSKYKEQLRKIKDKVEAGATPAEIQALIDSIFADEQILPLVKHLLLVDIREQLQNNASLKESCKEILLELDELINNDKSEANKLLIQFSSVFAASSPASSFEELYESYNRRENTAFAGSNLLEFINWLEATITAPANGNKLVVADLYELLNNSSEISRLKNKMCTPETPGTENHWHMTHGKIISIVKSILHTFDKWTKANKLSESFDPLKALLDLLKTSANSIIPNSTLLNFQKMMGATGDIKWFLYALPYQLTAKIIEAIYKKNKSEASANPEESRTTVFAGSTKKNQKSQIYKQLNKAGIYISC